MGQQGQVGDCRDTAWDRIGKDLGQQGHGSGQNWEHMGWIRDSVIRQEKREFVKRRYMLGAGTCLLSVSVLHMTTLSTT